MRSFHSSRGFLQGDPLSLFLFVIEGLSALIQEVVRLGQLSGGVISVHSPLISRLFFANDSIIFLSDMVNCAYELQDILRCYEHASGQEVNFQKSFAFFNPSIGVECEGFLMT